MSDNNEENASSDHTISSSTLHPGKIFKKVTVASLIAGFIILFLTLGTGGETGTMGKIVGFSFVLVGVIMFMSNTLSKIVRSKNEEAKSILSIVTTLGPFIPAIGSLAWAITLFVQYFDYIAKDQLTPSFNMFTTFLVLSNLFLIRMLYNSMNSKEFEKNQSVNKVSGMLMYFMELISFVILISMFIILRFFVTDGFKTYREGLKNISGNITLSSPGVNIKINK
jgi:hypothetical protein